VKITTLLCLAIAASALANQLNQAGEEIREEKHDEQQR
jgi:hypothetical protein